VSLHNECFINYKMQEAKTDMYTSIKQRSRMFLILKTMSESKLTNKRMKLCKRIQSKQNMVSHLVSCSAHNIHFHVTLIRVEAIKIHFMST